MARLAVKDRLAPKAHEVLTRRRQRNAVHVKDGVTSQERVRECYQMRHLSERDTVIEWIAWLVVLGLFLTTIWLASTL